MTSITLGKDRGRIDFQDEFDLTIRQKGFRARWSRAVICPCRLNAKTDQADPSCTGCDGDGWFYVLPDEAPNLEEHTAEGFVDTATGKATQIIVTSMAKNIEIFEIMGEWLFGSVRTTTFSFHKFAYRDRFTLVDGRSEYQQVIEMPDALTIPVGRKPKTHLTSENPRSVVGGQAPRILR